MILTIMAIENTDRRHLRYADPTALRSLPMRTLLAVLLLALTACDGAPQAPLVTTPAALVRSAEQFEGRRVTVEGTLRSWADPEHYWIEDAAPHRIALEPEDGLAGRVGEQLRVTGRFRYEPDRGRWLEVESLRVLDGS